MVQNDAVAIDPSHRHAPTLPRFARASVWTSERHPDFDLASTAARGARVVQAKAKCMPWLGIYGQGGITGPWLGCSAVGTCHRSRLKVRDLVEKDGRGAAARTVSPVALTCTSRFCWMTCAWDTGRLWSPKWLQTVSSETPRSSGRAAAGAHVEIAGAVPHCHVDAGPEFTVRPVADADGC